MTPNTSNGSDNVHSLLTPALFARTAGRGHWQMARMHAAIDRALTDTITGRTEPVLVVETPPRHGKSELISKYTPAWYLCTHPNRQVILASATADLAAKWGRQARAIVREWGPALGVGVSEDRGSADDWETTAGGGMRTAGVGGDVMGRGGHLLVIDDYLKNSEGAYSESIRDKQWDWWQSTFSTRLEPEGVVVVMATRWHEDDLIGRILRASESGEGLPVNRLRLPAVAEDNDPLGRAPGEALWPERWPLGPDKGMTVNAYGDTVVGLKVRQRMSSAHWWGALYQQRPTRDGLTAWPDAYFGDHIWPETWPEAFEASCIAIDPSKGKDAKRGDFSAVVFAGLTGGIIYVDAILERMPPDVLVRKLFGMMATHKPDDVGMETNQFQSLFAPIINRAALDRGLPPMHVREFENRTQKNLRIERLGPYLDHREMRFRSNAGCRELVRQLRDFPLGDHDDGPDALEMAVRLLKTITAERVDEMPDEEYAFTD